MLKKFWFVFALAAAGTIVVAYLVISHLTSGPHPNPDDEVVPPRIPPIERKM